jgi:deazaflavin-dependent oxidoreductase (nitroreductase family)
MTTFTPSGTFRLANRLMILLVRSGLPMGVRRAPMALLTVTVRNSGIARTTPVALAQHRDGWLLVSVYGVTDWSRNLEAAGRGWVTIRGKKREVTARRPEPTEAGPLLRDSISTAPAVRVLWSGVTRSGSVT